MKKRQLRQTYIWFIDKLVAMGALSKEEQEKELIFLNPNANGLKNAIKMMINTKMRSALCDQENMREVKMQMYEDGSGYAMPQRTVHSDIPPPEVRIKQYKTKQFKQINDAI